MSTPALRSFSIPRGGPPCAPTPMATAMGQPPYVYPRSMVPVHSAPTPRATPMGHPRLRPRSKVPVHLPGEVLIVPRLLWRLLSLTPPTPTPALWPRSTSTSSPNTRLSFQTMIEIQLQGRHRHQRWGSSSVFFGVSFLQNFQFILSSCHSPGRTCAGKNE